LASIHQLTTAVNGQDFMTIDKVTVSRQMPPKTARNNKLYSFVVLKSAGSEITLSLWDDAAKWKLPEGEMTLRGKFVKEDYQGKPSLRCEDLSPPEGATEFAASEIVAAVTKPSIKDCLDAGIRCADYMVTKKRPELAPTAFTFGANALLAGHRLE
jgi:hypothetical protein